VIGINSQIATGGGQGSVGIGFAVPIDSAKQELPKLRAGEEIKRAYLGVSMADATAALAKRLDLPVDKGALVQTVTNGSPADKAGLRAGDTGQDGQISSGGDLIVAVDGKSVSSAEDVVSAIAAKQPGDTVEIEYYRGNDKHTAKVKLEERPDQLSSTGQSQSPDGGGDLPFQLP